jgi:hypothetical protein
MNYGNRNDKLIMNESGEVQLEYLRKRIGIPIEVTKIAKGPHDRNRT